MAEIQEALLDAYAEEINIAVSSYELMGRLLDIGYVKRRLELSGLSEFYIYGGGYLGIQFYNIARKFVKILAVVDKKGALAIDVPYIPVIDINELKKVYKGQKVIITSVKFYREIKNDLSDFVSQDQIMFLGEVLGGILK